MKNKKILALTLGLSLAVGTLTGSYTMAQANESPAVNQNMQMGHEKPMNDKGNYQGNHQEMLKLLQIDEQTFKQEADSGKSLAEIAAAHNVSKQAVVDLVVKNMNQKIDKGLADKRFTAEQANEMKTNAVEKAQQMVDGKLMGFNEMHNKANLQEMLTLLQIDDQTFKQEAASGKSLAEIAAAHNVSRQAVIDVVVKSMNQHIDKGLTDKRITVEQANEMKTNAVEKAQQMVDVKPIGFDKMTGPKHNGHEKAINDKQNSQGVNNAQNSQDMSKQQNLQEMLTLLKIDEQTFAQEQNSGKSLAEIGIAHNVPRQEIVDLVTKNMNEEIDKGLAEERITIEQANAMKANAVEKIQMMVDKNMVEQPVQPQK